VKRAGLPEWRPEKDWIQRAVTFVGKLAANRRPDGEELQEGVQFLPRQLARIEQGERIVQPSPVEGPISHEQWCYFHLRHAELHLSFQIIGAK
jgi:hypothetical protein